VIASVVICIALIGAACGDSLPAREPVRDARLNGSVELCPGDFKKCVNVVAIITVLSVHGKTFGNAVAQQRTTNGRFSFLLAPGTYFPSASSVQARLHGGHCIAGDVTVRANEEVNDGVRCYVRVQPRR
jgi:hypothetical protein